LDDSDLSADLSASPAGLLLRINPDLLDNIRTSNNFCQHQSGRRTEM